METHDTIAEKSFNGQPTETKVYSTNGHQSDMNTQTFRIVGLRKIPDEPLVSFVWILKYTLFWKAIWPEKYNLCVKQMLL